jgi:hypothetical protein
MELLHCRATALKRTKQFFTTHVYWTQQCARSVVCKKQQRFIVLFFKFDHLDESREF